LLTNLVLLPGQIKKNAVDGNRYSPPRSSFAHRSWVNLSGNRLDSMIDGKPVKKLTK